MGIEDIKDTYQITDSAKKEGAAGNTYLEQLLGFEKAGVLLKKYFLDLAWKTDLLAEYFRDRNMTDIQKIAHQLKGSGKSYGFEYVTEVGAALSSYAKKGDYSALKDTILDLDRYAREQKKKLEKS